MRIVVVGGTGLIGARLVELLLDRGHEAVAASPRVGVDSVTGEGLAEVFAGAEVVVDVLNAPLRDDDALTRFFTRSTTNIVAAAECAGVKHLVVLSLIGADGGVDLVGARGKRAQEKITRESTVPYTIVRAAPFFESIPARVEGGAEGGVVRLPARVMQPIAAADVSAFLADAAVAAPKDDTLELAGPEAVRLTDLGRALLASREDGRVVVVDPHSGAEGAPLIPGQDPAITEQHYGSTRFAEWLADRRNTHDRR